MKYFGGCDVGSTYTKTVILDENGQRSDGEEDWDSERVPACASAEV